MSVLKAEWLKMQKRAEKQRATLAESQEAFDAASKAGLVAVSKQCDARVRRQTEALAATVAAVDELARAIASEDDPQGDIVRAADKVQESKNASGDAPSHKRR